MKRLCLSLLAAAVFIFPQFVHAQLGIYGAGTGALFSHTNKDVGYGGLAGIYKQGGHFANLIALGIDLRGTWVGRDGFQYHTYAAGPRLQIKPHFIPLNPYVEGLVGAANYNNGKGTNSVTHLNYQIVAGLDATLLPHFDWRVIDAAYSGVSGQSIHAVTLSTGFVIRLW